MGIRSRERNHGNTLASGHSAFRPGCGILTLLVLENSLHGENSRERSILSEGEELSSCYSVSETEFSRWALIAIPLEQLHYMPYDTHFSHLHSVSSKIRVLCTCSTLYLYFRRLWNIPRFSTSLLLLHGRNQTFLLVFCTEPLCQKYLVSSSIMCHSCGPPSLQYT